MADTNEIIKRTININRTLSIRPLPSSEIKQLAGLVVWDLPTSNNEIMYFGGKNFKAVAKENAVVIDTGSVVYDYELKTMLIASLHLGTIEGGTPYKWKSVATRIRTLRTFASFLQVRGFEGFRDLNNQPELKLRNLLHDFLNLPKSQGGMEQSTYTSAAKTVREAVTFLHVYGVVKANPLKSLIDELTLTNINKHEAEQRLKHAIIPTRIMKAVIAEATKYISTAKAKFEEFERINVQANSRLHLSKSKNPRFALVTINKNLLSDIQALYPYFRDLNLHVYTLVLAFTGMRDNEAYALKNDCHSCRIETEEKIYTIKSRLSKTAEGEIELDWIANDIVYQAVDLLSKINAIYKSRAVLLLTHHKHKMSARRRLSLENGLENNRLFGIRHTKHTTRFVEASKSHNSTGAISLSRHQIEVEAADIEQLEKVGCNYQSVSQISGKRGLKYKVGDIFHFTAHQFRHTFAWFIIANRLGDLDDIKYQFKHLHRVMTFVYTERGYESLSELRTVIEYFEDLANKQAIENIVESTKKGEIAGGGGERLAKFLAKLNANTSSVIYTTAHQSHFNSTQELIDFTTRHSDSVRGLPHGYCTKGAGCKIKNAADPSHCLYCDTYYTTPKHLPYWQAIKHSCEQKLARIHSLPDTTRYQAFMQGLEDNLAAANEITNKLMNAAYPPTMISTTKEN